MDSNDDDAVHVHQPLQLYMYEYTVCDLPALGYGGSSLIK